VADVSSGRFREDLLYRLNVVEILLPPLRDRPEDILPLARRLLEALASTAKRLGVAFSSETEAVLQAYAWPGNIRELRNAVERALIVWPAQRIEPAALPERIAAATSRALALGGPFTLESIEREHTLRVLAASPTLEEAARILGIDASTLWRRRKKYESC
jgi:NtrC-family two-component system response regulator AlgB